MQRSPIRKKAVSPIATAAPLADPSLLRTDGGSSRTLTQVEGVAPGLHRRFSQAPAETKFLVLTSLANAKNCP
jgi:hypothetical protein